MKNTMDITNVFKACVKTAKLKENDATQSIERILPKVKDKTNEASFHKRATDVVGTISKLRDFLFTYQTDYVGEFSPLVSVSSKMSDEERQQIDADAQTFIKSCTSAISSLKSEVTVSRSDGQNKAHSLIVLEILDFYLKEICKLYTQQKAFRIRQAVDQKRMSRLKPEKREATTNHSDGSELRQRKKEKVDDIVFNGSRDYNGDGVGTNNLSDDIVSSNHKSREVMEFTQEETQMFEEENERLYEELNNVDKEVRSIEGSVVQISQLQEIFQEKVLSQATQIESIHDTSVCTTENVKDGNEQIREAIKNSATFRVWILFFLVMCTFSLLFLDWYND